MKIYYQLLVFFYAALAVTTGVGSLAAEEVEVRVYDRPGFRLIYPAAWTLATNQPDYDPDGLFTIDTSGRSSVTFEFFEVLPGESPEQYLGSIITVLDGPLIHIYSRSPFSRWGKHQGAGVHLKGKVMRTFPGGVRLFVIMREKRGVLVTEIYYSEDLSEVMQGFDHIANTFEFKE